VQAAETRLAVRASAEAGAWSLDWGAGARLAGLRDGRLRLDAATRPVTVVMDRARVTVVLDGSNHAFEVVDPLAPPHSAPPGADHVLAPIPGRIASVLCKPGDTVARGQALVVLEAMKMEMTLTAAMDGTIAAVRCAVGDMVPEGADLVAFESGE